MPDATTMNRWANLISPATLESIHERVVRLARERKVTRGRKLRVDSTAIASRAGVGICPVMRAR